MESSVIFFDNICVLCSRTVHVIFKNDRNKIFYFASIDSQEFRKISDRIPDYLKNTDSVVLYSKGKVFYRSSAALRIAWKLKFPYPLLCIAFIVPPFLRDAVYDWIASNRYNWFGKTDSCFIPTREMKNRFLG